MAAAAAAANTVFAWKAAEAGVVDGPATTTVVVDGVVDGVIDGPATTTVVVDGVVDPVEYTELNGTPPHVPVPY